HGRRDQAEPLQRGRHVRTRRRPGFDRASRPVYRTGRDRHHDSGNPADRYERARQVVDARPGVSGSLPEVRLRSSIARIDSKPMARKPATIDAYLATVRAEKRAALDRLRKTIRGIVPKAEECISYGIPAFRLNGRIVAGFAATNKGCSYFPFSGSTLGTLAGELKEYEQTKSSLHFDPAAPLPAALVRKLIEARIAES